LRSSGYALVAPLIAVLSFVELYPLLTTIYISVAGYGEGSTFQGVGYYLRMVSDPQLGLAVYTSVAFAAGGTTLALLIGLGYSLLLTQLRTGRALVETLLLAPLATAPIVAGVIWSPNAVWDDINTFIHFVLGLPYLDLTNYLVYFPIMILSYAWEWSPIMMLLALSLIQEIPKEVREAAEVHGASAWKSFRMILLPAVAKSPVTAFVLVVTFVDGLRSFEIPFAWSTWVAQPNAGSSVDTLSLLLFKLLVEPTYGLPIGYISAVAVTLLAVTLAAALALMALTRRLGGIRG